MALGKSVMDGLQDLDSRASETLNVKAQNEGSKEFAWLSGFTSKCASAAKSCVKGVRRAVNRSPWLTAGLTSAIGAAGIYSSNHAMNGRMQEHQYHTIVALVPPVPGRVYMQDFYMMHLQNGQLKATMILPPYGSHLTNYNLEFKDGNFHINSSTHFVSENSINGKRILDATYPTPWGLFRDYAKSPKLAADLDVDLVASQISLLTGLPSPQGRGVPHINEMPPSPQHLVYELFNQGKLADAIEHYGRSANLRYPTPQQPRATRRAPPIQASYRARDRI